MVYSYPTYRFCWLFLQFSLDRIGSRSIFRPQPSSCRPMQLISPSEGTSFPNSFIYKWLIHIQLIKSYIIHKMVVFIHMTMKTEIPKSFVSFCHVCSKEIYVFVLELVLCTCTQSAHKNPPITYKSNMKSTCTPYLQNHVIKTLGWTSQLASERTTSRNIHSPTHWVG